MAKRDVIVNRPPGEREHCGAHIVIQPVRAMEFPKRDVPPAVNLVVGTIYWDGNDQIANAFLSPEECRQVAAKLIAEADRLEPACSDWERSRGENDGDD